MFKTLYTTIIDKISGLNPITAFIKYALNKFLKQLINDQIKLQDFKNGCLTLTKILLNSQKINTKHLVSSPYIVHQGCIGNLRIQLPSLLQINQKPIQIQVNEVLIEFKPNKNFYQNFKNHMKQLHQNSLFQAEEEQQKQEFSENCSIDYFKQTLKQILLNIRIKIKDIVIKVYMNNPEENNNQYYLMFRIPIINVHKNTQNKKGKIKDIQQIKLIIELPQFSIHLLNHNTKYPQFKLSVEQFTKKDFPFKYPTVHHPDTILLFGMTQLDRNNIQKNKNISKLQLTIATDYKNKKRQFKIFGLASNIQIMLNPIQLKFLSRFFSQIKQFKHIYEYVKNQLNFQQSNFRQSCQMNENSQVFLKRSKSENQKKPDIFASIIMVMQSYDEKNFLNKSNISKSNVIQSWVKQNPSLQKSVHQYQNNCKQQLKKQNLSQYPQVFITNFTNQIQINLQLSQIIVLILKSVPQQIYLRKWMYEQKEKKINQKIGGDYFLFFIKHTIFKYIVHKKNIELSFDKLKLQNIKLHNQYINKQINQKKQQFYQSISQSIQQEHFQSIDNNLQLFTSCRDSFQSFTSFKQYSSNKQFIQKNINNFQIQKQNNNQNKVLIVNQFYLCSQDHYCIQEIIRISQKPAENFYSKNIRKYDFLPHLSNEAEHKMVFYKPGFKFIQNKIKKSQYKKIQIQQISICLNGQLLKELLDIYYPINEFLNLLNRNNIIFQSNQFQINLQKKKSNKNNQNLFQSQFYFSKQYQVINQYIDKKSKPLIKLSISQINLGYYESNHQIFENLIEKNKNNNNLYNQNNKCFCHLNSNQFYFQCFGIQIDLQNSDLKLSIRKIVAGLIQLQKSKILSIQPLFRIESQSNSKNLRIYIENNQIEKDRKMSFFIPEIQIIIEQNQTLKCVQIIKRQVQCADNLKSYYCFLKNQMNSITHQWNRFNSLSNKKNQSYQNNFRIYIQQIKINFLNIILFAKKCFFNNSPNQIIVKLLSSIIVFIKQQIQFFLNQMKNQQLCLQQYIQKNSKFQQLSKKNIIFQIQDKNCEFILFDSKNSREFFDNISKSKNCLLLTICKLLSPHCNNKNFSINNKKSNNPFMFNKKPVQNNSKIPSIIKNNSLTIQQQQQEQSIFLDISNPIYISFVNLCILLHQKNIILGFLNKIQKITAIIVEQSKNLNLSQRKNSTDSDIDKTQQLKIKIAPGQIYIDLRPSFIQKNIKLQNKNRRIYQKRQIIFSNSRSFLQLQWQKINILINKRTQFVNIEALFNLNYNFLVYQDRQPLKHPIILQKQNLDLLGFLEIFSIKNLQIDYQKNKINHRLKSKLNLLRFQVGISTLNYLNLHFQHLTRHNLNRNFGLTLKQQQQIFHSLDIKKDKRKSLSNESKEQSDDQIEDITNAFEKYKGKIQYKKKQQIKFKQKLFQLLFKDQKAKFLLQQFKIKQCRIKINSGSDYQFITCESMNQSKQIKRSRNNDDKQLLKYLQLRIDMLDLKIKLTDYQKMQIQSLIKLENFEINYSNKKSSQGFFKRLVSNKSNYQQVLFPFLRSQGQIKILLEASKQRIYVKFNKNSLDVGFTSQILNFIDQIKSSKQLINQSGWKKVYQQLNQQQKEFKISKKQKQKLILIYIPENRININLIFKDIQLLTNQFLYTSEFLLHEQLKHKNTINNYVTQWVKNLLLKNASGLISGSAIKIFGKLVDQVLQLVRFLLSIVYRTEND